MCLGKIVCDNCKKKVRKKNTKLIFNEGAFGNAEHWCKNCYESLINKLSPKYKVGDKIYYIACGLNECFIEKGTICSVFIYKKELAYELSQTVWRYEKDLFANESDAFQVLPKYQKEYERFEAESRKRFVEFLKKEGLYRPIEITIKEVDTEKEN